jgi:hypothetical protein
MAERRMFAKAIIDSDIFLDMPLSTQALYFHLAMRADDEGFVNNPKKIQKMIGASDDDVKILIMKRYILTFESGIIVIKHWKIHNYIQNDRFKPTSYIEEKSTLTLDEKKSYVEIPNNVSILDTQVSIDKDSIELDKISIEDSMCDAKQVDTTPTTPPLITILLNDGSEYGIEEDYFNQMKKLFPGVDVMAELRKMSAWAINNPTKRKTKSGIKRFIGTWLSSAQDNATKTSSARKTIASQPQTQSDKVYRR